MIDNVTACQPATRDAPKGPHVTPIRASSSSFGEVGRGSFAEGQRTPGG